MLAKPVSAHWKMARTKRSAPAKPAGTTRATYRSGTKAPSRIVSWLEVDVGKAGERPLEDGQNEEIGAREARGYHPGNVPIGHEGPFQDRVLARGGAHAQHIPRVFDAVTLGGSR